MKKENFFGNGLAEISFSEEKRLAPFIFKLQKGLVIDVTSFPDLFLFFTCRVKTLLYVPGVFGEID